MLLSRCFLLFIHLLVAFAAAGQAKINMRLKHELDSIEVEDQKYRILLTMPAGPSTDRVYDSVARVAKISREKVGPYLGQQMMQIDSMSIKRISQIIQQFGYPGKTLVGTPTNEVALLVIQHSDQIPKYLSLIEKTASRGEVPFYLYGRMLDRKLMYEEKEQIYGTQGVSYGVLNKKTGKRETVSFIWPIHDAAHVNERRRKAGFDSTVEANAQRLRIAYKPMTLQEALDIVKAAEANP